MARLVTCGFEEGVIGNNVAIWDNTAGNAPTLVSDSAAAHSGLYRMITNSANASSQARIRIANVLTTEYSGAALGSEFFYRYYIKADDATPSVDTNVSANASNALAASFNVTWLTTGKLRLTNVVTAASSSDSGTTLSNNTYYRIEVRHRMHNTSGELELRLYLGDSTTILDTLTPANGDTINTNVHYAYFGKGGSTTVFSYDDIAINDGTGSFQNSWCGPGHINMVIPATDVENSWENQAGGTSSFANVDETPGTPDDTTYNEAVSGNGDVLGDLDRFGLTTMGVDVPSNAVFSVCAVYGRFGSTQTSSTGMRWKLYDEAATLTNGPNMNANVNGWKINIYNDQLSYNATGKTKSNFDSFKIGYEPFTDTITRARRVSAQWMNIEWTPSVGYTFDSTGGSYAATGSAVNFRQNVPLFLRLRR